MLSITEGETGLWDVGQIQINIAFLGTVPEAFVICRQSMIHQLHQECCYWLWERVLL